MTETPTQREYWGGKVGGEWAVRAEQIDTMLAPVTEEALARAGFAAGEAVLDIGCGSGATSMEIARHVSPGGRVVGADISPPLLAVARERAGGQALPVEFREADAGSADFGLRFDAAFSRLGVMFFDDPPKAFAHIRTLLRPDGRLTFICWRTFAENVWTAKPVEIIAPVLKAPLPKPDPDAPGPFAFAERAKVERILTQAGWRDIGLAPWDGDIPIGGGGVDAAAEFLLRIGPCARAIADQELDPARLKALLVKGLTPLARADGVALPAACWIVSARA